MKPLMKDIAPNGEIVSLFTLETMELKESRNKKPYLQLTLSDKTGVIRGYLWKNAAGAAGSLKPGAFVKVLGTTKIMKGFQIINVERIRPARKWELDRADFVPSGQMELFGYGHEKPAKKEMAA